MSSAFVADTDIESLLDEIQSRFRVDERACEQSPAGRTPFRDRLNPTTMTRPPRATASGESLKGNAASVSNARILIVDDEPINVRVCQKYLRELGYPQTSGVIDPTVAMETICLERPDLIILDIMMPGISGIDLLKTIRQDRQLDQIPVLILSASCDRETRLEVLEAGALDFLAKPIDLCELSPRIRNALMIKQHHDQMQNHALALEEAVRARTAELEASRIEVVHCLARAVEYRDDQTGRHVERVGRYAGIIARGMGFEAEFCRTISLAAQLHDIGKIGIPDHVLMKPSALTPFEYERIREHAAVGKRILQPKSTTDQNIERQHVDIGSRILRDPKSPLLSMAARIALTHHEKWNGTGYPQGLAGEDIPLEGRITAVADVFDALSSRRSYKEAHPLPECFRIVQQERGIHFDPRAVDAFFNHCDEIVAAKIEFSDG
jgi:putative two-component system response regulator